MDARTKMLQANDELGRSAFDPDGANERAVAVIDAEHVLRAARRSTERFGSWQRFLDIAEQIPSAAEKAAAIRLAAAAAIVKDRTVALETVLREHSSAVTEIERATEQLEEAQKSLKAALEQREQLR